MYYLEEEDSSHCSKAKSTVCRAESGSSAWLVARLVSGLSALSAGVDELATAHIRTLDQLLVLERLVLVA